MEISSKQLVAFLGAMFLTGLSFVFLCFLFVISTFSFEGQTLREKEAEDSFQFFALLAIVLVTLYVIYRYRKAGKTYAGSGISVTLVIICYFMILAGVRFYKNQDYYQPFDQSTWKRAELKPFYMAKTLMKKGQLLGRSKDELCALLGDTGYGIDRGDYISYQTEENWEFQVVLKQGRVTSVNLYQGGFDD